MGKKSVLIGFLVKDVMRRKVVKLTPESTIESALRIMIKHRVSGLLIEYPGSGRPAGVLSKTDIMGAYYADLPLSVQVGDIMSRPVLTCEREMFLEAALGRMKEHSVTRLYVTSNENTVVGVLAYPEIVGLMYRHCHYCEKSLFKGRYRSDSTSAAILRFTVYDIMTPVVQTLSDDATIEQAIEQLSEPIGTEVVICDDKDTAQGVVSVTDVVMAYLRNRRQSEPAREIMTTPVRMCRAEAMLEEAIQTMIFADVGRLFVQDGQSGNIIGVLSLADTAKARSGSCQACIVSRISLKE